MCTKARQTVHCHYTQFLEDLMTMLKWARAARGNAPAQGHFNSGSAANCVSDILGLAIITNVGCSSAVGCYSIICPHTDRHALATDEMESRPGIAQKAPMAFSL